MGGGTDKSAGSVSTLLDGEEDTARADGLGEGAEIPLVKIPVRCPQCNLEQLCEFPEPVVIMALTRWNNMNLYVPCHDGYWCASRGELRVIRQFLGEAWIKSRAQHPRLHLV